MKRLLLSGHLPLKIKKELPLDAIMTLFDDLMSEGMLDGGDLGESLGPWAVSPLLKEGVTHAKNGAFADWIEECSGDDKTWLEELRANKDNQFKQLESKKKTGDGDGDDDDEDTNLNFKSPQGLGVFRFSISNRK